MKLNNIGVIGLAVMGKNLALNIESKGFSVSVYNRSSERTVELLDESKCKSITGTFTIEEFVNSLDKPRKILIMVKAGSPVDDTIKHLLPYLSKGDLIIDGGNSFYMDTIRRGNELDEAGIKFIGMGISGGEEGALKGPSIMPGGHEDAYREVEHILTAISAKVDSEPCCRYIGNDGAGHFVKMVHNGIEYGDMQLICEAYSIMKNILLLSAEELHNIFEEWNKGELDSYLIEITGDILSRIDLETGKPMVDIILDSASQKGTGKWVLKTALDLGVPIPTIAEAVFARDISSLKDERIYASSVLKSPGTVMINENKNKFIEAVRRALYASKICSYAQGFSLMRAAAAEYNWKLNFGDIASIFRGGCIIRARFLKMIKDAYDKNSGLTNLLLDPFFNTIIQDYQKDWRAIVSAAAESGIPVPAFSSSLSYFDSYRSPNLPANLLQAQRDYFGAHTFRRIDREGIFHYDWI